MLKHIRNILFIFIGMVAVGYLALVCVYALPTKPISQNVAEASNIMQMDGSHPELIYGHQDTMLDNLTDSKMLGIARYNTTKNIFEEALLSNRVSVDGMMDSQIIAEEELEEKLNGEVVSYGRYWHGYLLYLKPLLLVLNYGQIRYFISLVQFALLITILYLFVKKGKERHIIPFAMAYLFLNPATLSLSLQYFSASVITMTQFVILLMCEDKYKTDFMRWIYHFFIVGILIAYFDFLTYPLLTLGMPLVFLFAENKRTLKDSFVIFVGCCAAWGIGYAGMWGSKWVLGTLFTKENMILDALRNVSLRVGVADTSAKISAMEVIAKNVGANKLFLLTALIMFALIAVYGIIKYRIINIYDVNVGIILCAALPIAWYMVVSDHSMVHYWFTYRIIAISIYAMLISAVTVFIKKQKG